jgi:ankyrin repeat protein
MKVAPHTGATAVRFVNGFSPESFWSDELATAQRWAVAAAEALSSSREREALAAMSAFLAHGGSPEDFMMRGNTILTLAVSVQSLAAVVFLLEHGADPNAPRSDGASPLHLAAGSGNAELMHHLIQWGANPSVVMDDGITPLQEVMRLAPSRYLKECRNLLLFSGHCETAHDRLDWHRRRAADAAEVAWRLRCRCEDQPPPEEGLSMT